MRLLWDNLLVMMLVMIYLLRDNFCCVMEKIDSYFISQNVFQNYYFIMKSVN